MDAIISPFNNKDYVNYLPKKTLLLHILVVWR